MSQEDEPREYGLTQAYGPAAQHLRHLRHHCKRFCDAARRHVSQTSDASGTFNLLETIPILYDGFLDMLPAAASMIILETTRCRLPVIWQIDRELLVAFIDSILGGDGSYTAADSHQLTTIETALAMEIISDFVAVWSAEWPSIERAGLKPTAVLHTKTASRNIPLRETFIVAIIESTIARTNGNMRLAFPPALLGELVDETDRSDTGCKQNADNTAGPDSELGKCRVCVSARLAGTELTLSKLSTLEVGDVVKLDRRPNDCIDIAIAGKYKYRAMAGRINGSVAVKLTGKASRT